MANLTQRFIGDTSSHADSLAFYRSTPATGDRAAWNFKAAASIFLRASEGSYSTRTVVLASMSADEFPINTFTGSASTRKPGSFWSHHAS
jgi:hypothetical protein